MNTVQIGDTIYTITPELLGGIEDCARGISYHGNPYRYGSRKHDDWNEGHAGHDDFKAAGL